MSYAAGRLLVYVDTETAKAEYTNTVFNSMTTPLVTQLCNLLGMVVFSDLTESTARGDRYFIGFDGSDYPSLAIGWAVNNTYAPSYYLMAVGMFQGEYLNNILDASGSSSISNSQFAIVLINRYFGNANFNYNYINYIKTSNFVGMTATYNGNSPAITSNNAMVFCVMKSGTSKLMCYKNLTSNSSIFNTYDLENNGLLSILFPNIAFSDVKTTIANSDFNYIVQVRQEHYKSITDLFIYSYLLTLNKIYKINGEYYFCLSINTKDSYLVKVEDYA